MASAIPSQNFPGGLNRGRQSKTHPGPSQTTTRTKPLHETALADSPSVTRRTLLRSIRSTEQGKAGDVRRCKRRPQIYNASRMARLPRNQALRCQGSRNVSLEYPTGSSSRKFGRDRKRSRVIVVTPECRRFRGRLVWRFARIIVRLIGTMMAGNISLLSLLLTPCKSSSSSSKKCRVERQGRGSFSSIVAPRTGIKNSAEFCFTASASPHS